MRISNSEIQTFKRCKRKWWFQYYLQLHRNVEPSTGPMSIGNRVHSSLEAYYKSIQNNETTEYAVARALDRHDDDVFFDLSCIEDAGIDPKKFNSEAELTRLMLEGYFEWLAETGADEGLAVVATEKSVEVHLHPGRYQQLVDLQTPVTVMGKLDRRVYREHDKAVVFDDFKTTQDLSTPLKTLHLNEQTLMYEWLLHQTEPGARVDGGTFTFLRKCKRTHSAKPPFYARATIRHSPAELESFHIRLLGEIRDIIHTRRELDLQVSPLHLVYPTPTRDCSWDCPFFQVCPMVDRADGSATRMIELTMTNHDPYERYDTEVTQ